MIALAVAFEQPTSPENFLKPPPWPVVAIEVLLWCQAGVSLVAAVVACWLVPGWWRLLAWFVVLAVLGTTLLVAFGANMAVRGIYL
jgi:hypothetical protein